MAGSRGLGDGANWWAPEWAPDPGRDLSAQIIEAAYRELHDIACVKARGIVRSPDVAEDMVQDVWVRMLAGTDFNPDRGPFTVYFLTAVRNRCIAELRNRKTVPASDDMIEWVAGLRYQDGDSEHEEVLERVANLEGNISAALDLLKLRPAQAVMLRMMIGPEPSSRFSGSDRQARRRLRARVEVEARLTREEREAASLMRQHHDIAAAATAVGLEVRELLRRMASAERKVLGLFNIPSED